MENIKDKISAQLLGEVCLVRQYEPKIEMEMISSYISSLSLCGTLFAFEAQIWNRF